MAETIYYERKHDAGATVELKILPDYKVVFPRKPM